MKWRDSLPAAVLSFLLALSPGLAGSEPPASAGGSNPDFSLLVSREQAVVVSITTTKNVRGTSVREEGQGAQPKSRFDSPSPLPFKNTQHSRQERSVASGLVISQDGYILTNAHAVSGIEEAVVRLADKRQYVATVIGLDQRTDVALVKIDAAGLAAASIGDPSRLVVGEWVVAMGAPFGFESSVTAGIVSARPRFFNGGGGVPFIQTDVAINPGSSGGPLFNLRGEVVGINSMIFSGSGGYMGVSFTLPIDVAMKVATDLRTHGRVIRGHLGVQIQELTPELARSFGVQEVAGALVVRVVRGGPAERAGLRSGDVVLGIDEETDTSYVELQQRVAAKAPGSPLMLNIWRRGDTLRVAMTVIELPAGLPVPSTAPPKQRGDRLGLTLRELNWAERVALKIDGGLVVLEASGVAYRAGIGPEDVILALNDVAIGQVAEFEAALASVPAGKPVALLVRRNGVHGYVAIATPN